MTEFTPITAAEMRKIEQEAISSGRVTGLELMERAGRGVVEAILGAWPEFEMPDRGARPSDPRGYLGQDETERQRAIVLCGPGNNGGDGFVVARLLVGREVAVDVFFLGDADKLPPDARVNYDRWCDMGTVHPYDGETLTTYMHETLSGVEGRVLVIDALFGIGQRAPMDTCLEPLNALIDGWGSEPTLRAAPVFVAIDLPTGIDADTGAALARRPARADLIVTFHQPKPCHVLPHGPLAKSALVVKDIGL